MSKPTGPVRILHVDDESEFLELTREFLERERERFSIESASDADEGLKRLATEDFDCVISDFDMPGPDGIDFLEAVREEYPDLPFVLFTGKGSEAIAGEAISAGVSDYLQKGGGGDQFTVLANRIDNLVSGQRARDRVARYDERECEGERYRERLLEITADPAAGPEEKAERLLELGRERLGAENGHLVKIDEASNRHEVIDVSGSDIVQKGVTDLSETYCRRTIESDGIFDVEDAVEAGLKEDPAYREFGLGCYIGRKLLVEGELFGTLCYVSSEPREEPFTSDEKTFFELLSQWFMQLLERQRRQTQAETVFEHAQDGIFLIDVRADGPFAVQRVNRAYEELTGLSSGEMEGKTPSDIVGPECGSRIEARYRECVDNREPIEYEEQLPVGPGDEPRHFQTKLAPIVEGDEVVKLVGATRDVTEQVQQQAELEAERAFIEEALDTLDDVLYVVDADGQLQRWNDRLSAVTGYEDSEIETMAATDFFPPEERDRIADAIEEALLTGKEIVESEVLTADDERIPYEFTGTRLTDPSGDVIGVIGIGRDVTARRRRERSLEALHARTRAFITASHRKAIAEHTVETVATVLNREINTLWLYDEGSDALRPAAWTEAAEDLFEEIPTYTGEGSLSWEAFQTGEVYVVDELNDVDEIHNPDTPIRSEIVLPLGEYGVLNIGSTDARAFDDIDVSLARILGDMVEAGLARTDREAELRARQRDLERQNERLEEFASIVSHDLRNPLNVADARVQLARDECETEHLSVAARSIDRMALLIEDILQLAQEGQRVGERELIDLDALCTDCWDTIDATEATLVTDVDRSIRADRSRLRQLLENLFGNAIEHGAENVTITVGTTENGFYVADDGPGIDPDDREAVFESGYTTTRDGTGYGLAIVREIVDAHGWEITVTESDDGGARFEITDVEFA